MVSPLLTAKAPARKAQEEISEVIRSTQQLTKRQKVQVSHKNVNVVVRSDPDKLRSPRKAIRRSVVSCPDHLTPHFEESPSLSA
jgi:hypothetical protein